MARLLADEQFPMQVVYLLRSKGHCVEPARGYCYSKFGDGISDEAWLRFCIQDDRIVLTFNRKHFEALADRDEYRGHKGIIACVEDIDESELADLIDAELRKRQHFDSQVVRITKATPPRQTTKKRARSRKP